MLCCEHKNIFVVGDNDQAIYAFRGANYKNILNFEKDYPEDIMDQLIATETPEHVLERASWTHFYVAESEGSIVGCGAIGPYWGKEDESSLFTIFVDPDHQGKGIGRLIIDTLENDEFFLRAKRIEIPASITGVPFYLKMGYCYKNGITEPDEEHIVRMEKSRE